MCNPSLGQRVDMSALGQRGAALGAWELPSWFRLLLGLSLVLLGLRDLCFKGSSKKLPAGKDETSLRLS